MNKINAFVKEFIAIIKGDDAEALGLKNWRYAESALKIQITSLGGELIKREDEVEKAKEQLLRARVNFGNEITNSDIYSSQLLRYKDNLTKVEKELEATKRTIEFFNEQYDLLRAEVK